MYKLGYLKKFVLLAWIVAPLAYQKGPLIPYSQATLELCKMVAAQVHLQVITNKNEINDTGDKAIYKST